TTTSITAVSVSTRRIQSSSRPPEWIHSSTETLSTSACSAPCAPSAAGGANQKPVKTIQLSTAAAISNPVVMYSLVRCPMSRPSSPAISAPISGKKTIAWITASALHHVDVLNRDGAAVAVEDHKDGEADGGFGSGDREDQQREDLPGMVAKLGRKGHEVE